MVNIVLNPRFEHLRRYVEMVPEQMESRGEILEAGRNLIKQDKVDGVHLVIKQYRRIYFPNKVRYSFFYPSKAQRAYDYGIKLLQNGFNTPTPIAYIEVRRNSLIQASYFICEYTSLTTLTKVVEGKVIPPENLMVELARFTYSMHQKHLYHIDYSVGNILYQQQAGRIEFALIDNNRMKFGPVSFNEGIRNLVRLGLPVTQLTLLAEEYTRLRGVNVFVGLERFFRYKRADVMRRENKHKLKKFFGRA
ncbi:lipopolysaccharide kinase InaA family protein [Chryseolinea sp. T2]|uniref:lipopolysaccharide kinase InaA family protein n=1 Tax=Chryseolinea sp. T2 TaxID=3129255 RepID=UPI00307875CD